MGAREPAVAGTFYEASREALQKQIQEAFFHPLGPQKGKGEGKKERQTVAAILPHAGYMYSGPIAAWGYQKLSEEKKPEGCVLLGPDHRAGGDSVSVPTLTPFQTPLGDFPVPKEWVEAALTSPVIKINNQAHLYEHSLEVHLPFLSFIYGPLPILPLTFYRQTPEVAYAVASFLLDFFQEKDILVIASSDCSHYIPDYQAREKDRQALEYVKNTDSYGFYKIIMEKEITFCGPGPIMTALFFVKQKGIEEGSLLSYATSGDTGGGRKDVVGYATVVFTKKRS